MVVGDFPADCRGAGVSINSGGYEAQWELGFLRLTKYKCSKYFTIIIGLCFFLETDTGIIGGGRGAALTCILSKGSPEDMHGVDSVEI